jgi:hypothetical protein
LMVPPRPNFSPPCNQVLHSTPKLPTASPPHLGDVSSAPAARAPLITSKSPLPSTPSGEGYTLANFPSIRLISLYGPWCCRSDRSHRRPPAPHRCHPKPPPMPHRGPPSSVSPHRWDLARCTPQAPPFSISRCRCT